MSRRGIPIAPLRDEHPVTGNLARPGVDEFPEASGEINEERSARQAYDAVARRRLEPLRGSRRGVARPERSRSASTLPTMGARAEMTSPPAGLGGLAATH